MARATTQAENAVCNPEMSANLTQEETIVALRRKCALLEASLKQAEHQVETLQAKPAGNDMEAARRVFDRDPEDVLAAARNAVETLGWLEHLFKDIRNAVRQEQPDLAAIEKVADMGWYLASDASNSCDAQLCEMGAALSKAEGGAS